MKYAWLVLLVVVAIGAAGCAHTGMYCAPKGACMMGSCANAPQGCAPCGGGQCGMGGHGGIGKHCGMLGGRGQTMPYPYYTLRGPRDFLMKNPQPVGP
jgi:hypothetical protein